MEIFSFTVTYPTLFDDKSLETTTKQLSSRKISKTCEVQIHFQLRDAQLNMDVIEKRVSGNERVHNWWAVGPE